MWIDLTDCNHNKKSLKQHLFIKAANPTHLQNLRRDYGMVSAEIVR